jgi:hypothetical protein
MVLFTVELQCPQRRQHQNCLLSRKEPLTVVMRLFRLPLLHHLKVKRVKF